MECRMLDQKRIHCFSLRDRCHHLFHWKRLVRGVLVSRLLASRIVGRAVLIQGLVLARLSLSLSRLVSLLTLPLHLTVVCLLVFVPAHLLRQLVLWPRDRAPRSLLVYPDFSWALAQSLDRFARSGIFLEFAWVLWALAGLFGRFAGYERMLHDASRVWWNG